MKSNRAFSARKCSRPSRPSPSTSLTSLFVLIFARRRVQPCAECDDPVSHVCSTCNTRLCIIHALAHQKSRNTKDHVIAPLPGSSSSRCAIHPACDLTGVCEKCLEPVCRSCDRHADHQMEVVPLHDGLQAALDNMNARLQRRQGDLQARMSSAKTTMDALWRHSVATSTLINTQFDGIIKSLRERIRLLEARRDTLRTDAHTAIAADIKTAGEQRDRMIVLNEHIARACTASLSVAALRRMKQLDQIPVPVLTTSVATSTSFSFAPPDNILTADISQLGVFAKLV